MPKAPLTPTANADSKTCAAGHGTPLPTCGRRVSADSWTTSNATVTPASRRPTRSMATDSVHGSVQRRKHAKGTLEPIANAGWRACTAGHGTPAPTVGGGPVRSQATLNHDPLLDICPLVAALGVHECGASPRGHADPGGGRLPVTVNTHRPGHKNGFCTGRGLLADVCKAALLSRCFRRSEATSGHLLSLNTSRCSKRPEWTNETAAATSDMLAAAAFVAHRNLVQHNHVGRPGHRACWGMFPTRCDLGYCTRWGRFPIWFDLRDCTTGQVGTRPEVRPIRSLCGISPSPRL